MLQRTSSAPIWVSLIRVALFICISIALLTVSCDGRRRKCKKRARGSTNRIVGGWSIDEGDFPEFVSLQFVDKENGNTTCSGVLIDDDMVLTVAHCVIEPRWQKIYAAPSIFTPIAWERLGAKVHSVAKACPSEQYHLDETGRAFYDFAVLLLETPVENATVAALETKPIELGKRGTVVGAGLEIYKGQSNGQLYGQYPARVQALHVESVECYERNIHESHVCFSYYDLKHPGDTCYGDSGGPVLSDEPNRTILALTSYENKGEECWDKQGLKAKSVWTSVPNMRHKIEELIRRCRS